jgi:hypothetical protein
MAALLTVLAVAIGIGVGLANGGSLDHVRRFRPQRWQIGVAGLAVEVLIRVSGMSGSPAVVLDLLATVALVVFVFANIRLGGMVLIAAGLILNLLPTFVNWGMPVSRGALERADVIDQGSTGRVELEGPRHVASDDDWLTWLGEVIALPTGQVISFGDGVLQAGYLLTTAALLRGRRVRRTNEGNYRRRIAPLGEGPARRRGPGLHPSRLDPRTIRRGYDHPAELTPEEVTEDRW